MNKEFAKMDARSLHLSNKITLLKIIKQKQKVSRSALTKMTGLTPPTIARIVSELVEDDNLVAYVGVGDSNGGRPPVIVRLKNEGNYIIGIDLGATSIRGCLVDLNAKFVSNIQIPTKIDMGFDNIIDDVLHIIEKLRSRSGKNSRIWGVGIGVAGLVNSETGIIEHSPDFGWSDINLNEVLKNKLDIPFFYDNSTRLMALGELNLGSYPNLKNFAFVNMGYGIASGLVLEGKLVKGNTGFAGEFGHISVDTCSKVKCKCGMYGCLEALSSGHRISELGKDEVMENKAEVLNQLCNGNPKLITAELVAKSAIRGDASSIKIYEDITEYLCKGLGTISNLFNPELIFIGGGISLNGKFFFDMIDKKLPKYLLNPNANMSVIQSSFGEEATTIGAVSLVLEKIMNMELIDNN